MEGVADRPIALVPREEAVEDVLTVVGQDRECLVDRNRLVQPDQRVVHFGRLDHVLWMLLGASPQPVDTEAPGQLGEPRPDRVVVPELVEMLVGPRENLLKHVLCVVLRQLERLDGDRVDVAREALDELVPGFLVAGAAARHQLPVGQLDPKAHRLNGVRCMYLGPHRSHIVRFFPQLASFGSRNSWRHAVHQSAARETALSGPVTSTPVRPRYLTTSLGVMNSTAISHGLPGSYGSTASSRFSAVAAPSS